jgi:hypothetical protein
MITPYEKEKTMDNSLLYLNRFWIQREIMHELGSRLFRSAEEKSLPVKRMKPLVLTFVRVASAITILMLFVFFM